MVFNPSPYSRCDTIAFDLGIEDDHVTDLAVYDSAGNAIPHQFVSTENYSHSPASLKYVSAIFQATVPPASPAVFRVEQVKRKLHYPSSLKISRTSLENEYLRLKLNERGMIYSLIDKTTGNEYIDRKRPYFNSLVYQHDFGDLWLYYRGPLTDGYFYRTPYPDPLPEPKNQPGSLVFECGLYSHDNIQNIEVIEQGPVRIGLRLEGVLNASRHGCGFTQYIYLSKNSKRIDFRTEIMPSGKHYRIRAVFPTPIENGLIRHEIPFGNVIREAGEYPAQNWMDYADRAKGLCLLNKGLPGNNVSDGCLMLSLMRSTSFETRGEETGKSEKAYEIGIPHRFEYAVIPYSNSDQSYHPAVCGQEFNMPFISRIIEPTGEDATLFPCGIKISPKNILLTAYYKTGNKIIARLYESEGRCSTVKISLPPGCIQAFEADVSGENLKPLEVENLEIVVVIQPFKIKTFVFKK
jgi:alpha-mannosidase